MSDPPPPPQVSPDGKFYWDGQRWLPMPQQSRQPEVQRFPDMAPNYRAPEPTAPRQGLRARLGMTGAVNSCVGYGCLGIALIFVFAAIAGFCGSGSH